jgi:hypothetical protein
VSVPIVLFHHYPPIVYIAKHKKLLKSEIFFQICIDMLEKKLVLFSLTYSLSSYGERIGSILRLGFLCVEWDWNSSIIVQYLKEIMHA